MRPFSIAYIGHTGHGKSEFAKDTLRKTKQKPCFVYDVQNEYTPEFQPSMGGLPKVADFMKKAVTLKGHNIVFEEATIFLNSSSRVEEVRHLIVSKRHTLNNIHFIFHSLRSVPVEIYDLLDFIVLFRTNDRKTLINNKFKDDLEILEAFDYVQEATDNSIDKREFKRQVSEITSGQITNGLTREQINNLPEGDIKNKLTESIQRHENFYKHVIVSRI